MNSGVSGIGQDFPHHSQRIYLGCIEAWAGLNFKISNLPIQNTG